MRTNYKSNDIVKTIRQVGICEGDTVFVHSNLGYFGVLEDAACREGYADAFLRAFLEVLGPTGDLVVPTFSYSFCRGEDFNPEKTPSTCGLFSETVRMDERSVRSEDANFSIAVIGPRDRFYTENPPEYSFGPGSFWDRFLQNDGIFCNLNFDAGSTFIHYVERELQVPYRWDKPFRGRITTEHSPPVEKVFYHFVYDLEKTWDAPDFARFSREAETENIVAKSFLGRGNVVAISAKDTYEFVERRILVEPRFLLKQISPAQTSDDTINR